MAWYDCFTVAQIQTKIDNLMDAIDGAADGQDVEMEGRKLEMADIDKLQKSLERWCSALQAKQGLNGGGGRKIVRGVPVMSK